jgi:hypothetical protein
MILEFSHFLFHGTVDKVEIANQLTVGIFLDNALEKAFDKADVLRHGVGFFRPFPQLGS